MPGRHPSFGLPPDFPLLVTENTQRALVEVDATIAPSGELGTMSGTTTKLTAAVDGYFSVVGAGQVQVLPTLAVAEVPGRLDLRSTPIYRLLPQAVRPGQWWMS